ncbi:MAG: DEAD/DEAH box helicase [Planctomycetes bacterium]|nr:DEAD/DEAH box helicase [Planctomycetota bacterium]
MPTFAELPLLPSLLETLNQQGLSRPTDIQTQALPPLLEGRSLVGVSPTGSGKTLAYALPLLQRLKQLDGDDPVLLPGRPRGVVLVPGRELGEQVGKVLKSLTHDTRLRVRLLIGGTAKEVARQNIKGIFDVLVATPGRLQQLLEAEKLRVDDVRFLVLDEADQLLDRGFLPIAERIVHNCHGSLQVALFAATLPDALKGVIKELFPTAPVHTRARGSQRTVPTLRTENREIEGGEREDVLLALLGKKGKVGTFLFANTRAQCETVCSWLEAAEIAHVRYFGEMESKERRQNLKKFRDGEVDVLVTTDLGGRGLDIERVERVVNVHLPQDVDNYLHRVGRTARAGRSGLVVNFVTQRDNTLLAKLKRRESTKG